MYVVADERDVLKLRALHRKDTLYLYQGKATPQMIRELFVDMLTRANTLNAHPEFYNTLTSTCTTNIRDHINKVAGDVIPWDLRILFPLKSDEYAYELGLIENDIPLTELRAKSKINDRIEEFANDPQFSKKIRGLE